MEIIVQVVALLLLVGFCVLLVASVYGSYRLRVDYEAFDRETYRNTVLENRSIELREEIHRDRLNHETKIMIAKYGELEWYTMIDRGNLLADYGRQYDGTSYDDV